MKTLLAYSVILAAISTNVLADPTTRTAIFDPSVGPNNYTIQFPAELSGATVEMNIVGGSFDLVIDAEAGTADLASWHQEIDPVILFGMSTGPITISLVTEEGENAAGTYDAETREFSVEATFQIEFDDSQRWQVGFVSPVILTAGEEGTIHGSGTEGHCLPCLTLAGHVERRNLRQQPRAERLHLGRLQRAVWTDEVVVPRTGDRRLEQAHHAAGQQLVEGQCRAEQRDALPRRCRLQQQR